MSERWSKVLLSVACLSSGVGILLGGWGNETRLLEESLHSMIQDNIESSYPPYPSFEWGGPDGVVYVVPCYREPIAVLNHIQTHSVCYEGLRPDWF